MTTSLCGVEVEVIKAINIIAADKSGTSDPYCKLKLVQADGKVMPSEEYKTKTIQRTLNPEWDETISMGTAFQNMKVLVGCKVVATLYDMDKGMFDADDPLGQIEFGPIQILAKKKKLKMDLKFALQTTPAMTKEKVTATGELHLRLKLLGDPNLLYEEFNKEAKALPDEIPNARDASNDVSLDEEHAKMFEGKPCNELHLSLVSAKGLVAMDTSVFGKATSDPYVCMSVNSVKKQSTTKKKTLTPEWHENFVFPSVDDPACAVTLEVMDYDLVGSNDFMGKVVIPLSNYGDKLKHTETLDLTNAAGGQDEGVDRGSVTIAIWWKHSPELAKLIEMDFSDDKEEDEIERKAQERAAAIEAAKAQAKEERKRAAQEALMRVELEEKEHQYHEEISGAEEEFQEQRQVQYETEQEELRKNAGVRQWEDEMAKLAAVPGLGEPVEYEEWFASNADQIDFTRKDFDSWCASKEPFKIPTFEEWRETVDVREIGVLLAKLELRVTADEFVNRYRQAKPETPVHKILGLLRFEADPQAEQSAMAKTLDGTGHFNDITGEPEEEEEEEEESEDARVVRLLLPNELCIALVRARALVAADVSMLGASTSDPMVTFEVDGEVAMSQCIKKNLNPIWREKFSIPLHHFNSPIDGHSFTLRATVEDVDLLGANDFLGRTLPIDITTLNKRWSKPTWYPLVDEDDKMDKKKPRGAIELACRLRHNADLIEPPLIPAATEVDDLEPESEENMAKEPNELRLTLWRARELQVMDKSMFGGGGSSDPLVRFNVVHEAVASEAKKKSLNPEWNQSWKLKADAPDGILEVIMEDVDDYSGNDFMGKVIIPLNKMLKKRQPLRRWFRMGDKNGKRAGPSRGDVDLQLRWCHNPSLVEPEEALTPEQALRPPKGERKATKGKPRNELLVTVVQARNLPVMDKNLFSAGGSSDPYFTLTVADGGDRAKTTVKKRNLNPVYKETFKLACPQDLDASVEILVEDYDVAGENDFMGKVVIPLAPMAAGNAHRAWYTLGDEKTGRPDGVQMRGQVELVLRWKHNPDFAEGEPLEEVDGDEYPDKKPNELRIGLIRARKLPVMDKSLLGGKGSSDPIVTIRVGGHEHVSPLKKKTLAPRWNWRCCIPAVNPKNVLLETTSGADVGEGGKKKKKKKKKDKKRKKKDKSDSREEVKAEAEPEAAPAAAEPAVHNHDGLECVKLSDSDADFHIEIIVDDWDAASGNDFMGRLVIPIKPLKHKRAVRQWYTLAPEATGDTLWPDLEMCGEVELLLKWWYNPALDYSDLEDPNAEDLHPDKFPNEMKIALLSARNLLVMDKNMFTGKGTSDPVVKFSIGTASKTSSVKYKELEPEWNERFLLPADHLSTEIDVLVEDVDALSANDFMGHVKIPLAQLANKKPIHAWYPLGGKAGIVDEDEEPRGEIEIICRWWFNPALEPVPLPLVPEETTEALAATANEEKKFGKRLPNELRVAVIRAARLPVMDTSLLGGGPGTADPFVKLELPGFEKRTTVKPKNLNPVWGEKFVMGPLQYEVGHVLKCVLFDYDIGSGNDFMGQVNIPLVDLVSRVPIRKWYRITDKATANKGGESGAAAGPDLGRLEVWLRYVYNPLHDPTWVEPPILIETFTSTALDLPTLPPELFEKKEDEETIETPRWFYLETPRLDDADGEYEDGPATIEDAPPRTLPPLPSVAAEDQEQQGEGANPSEFMAIQPFNGVEEKSIASFENRSVQFLVPRGPYNEASLKDLFDARGIHNATRVWTEGMDEWTAIDLMQGLKRRLWSYPELPLAKPHELTSEADKANKRWFFVDEHLDEEGVEAEIIGPESLDELRERFEGAAVGDHTMAWREGQDEWQALDDFNDGQVGRAAGWKPRREHDGLHLPRFDLSMECTKCGGVATLHSFDALGNKVRIPPPSGRMKTGSTTDMAEILSDFLWIGNFAASRKKFLEKTSLSHIINCTEDIDDALNTRDLVEKPSERATICYLSVPIPDVIDENWDDAVDEDGDDEVDLAQKEALREEQRKRGFDKDQWLVCLDRSFDFIESAERLEAHKCRVMVHSSRGSLRAPVIMAAYLIRKFGLRKSEALGFVATKRKEFVGDERLTNGANDALDEYEAEYALGRFFCDDCFDEHRYGREDTAMSLVIEAAALKLRQSDVTLTDLDLRGEPLAEADVAVLTDSLCVTHCKLIEVDFSGTLLGDAGIEVMCRGLATCKTIDRITLQYTGIGDKGAHHIAKLIGFDSGLEHPAAFLDLGFNRIGPKGADELAQALHLNECLTYLDLRSNKLGDEGGVALSKALCDPDYESYLQALIETGANDSSSASAGSNASMKSLSQVEFLRRYKRNTGITYLNLVSNALGQACCKQLCEVLKMNSTMVALELAFNPMLGSHEVKTLANFIRLYNPPIEVLSVGQMVFGDDVSAAFAKVLALDETQLRSLALPRNRLLSTSAKRLATSLVRNTVLTSLALPQNPLGTKGAGYLCSMLEHNSTIRYLDLESVGFDKPAAECVGRAFSINTTLTQVDLSDNNMGANGIRFVAEALQKNHSLKLLRLDGVSAGIVGAEFLARALARNDTLTSISFANNNIRNPGAKAFAAALFKNITLQSIDLSFNNFDGLGGGYIVSALTTTSSVDRDHNTLELNIDMIGNVDCEDILPPKMARSKRRWDFLPATRLGRLLKK